MLPARLFCCAALATALTSCGGSSAPAGFTVGGSVSGLAPGNSVVLMNNGGDALTVTSNSSFKFSTVLTGADSYNVTVARQPAGQACWENYSQGKGFVADVNNVLIECSSSESQWSFGAGTDGASPWTSLIQGPDGALYGTTTQGGDTNHGGTTAYGTVFRVTLQGAESVLWNFQSGADGANPYGALVVGRDGNFYGTTLQGGAHGVGVVFKLTPAGVESVLWNFGSGVADGKSPYAGLTLGTDGNFYGTTSGGGSAGYGTVFRITPDGVETVLWSFGVVPGDGSYPTGPLLQASDGIFYGTTAYGGKSGGGTVFAIPAAGTETVLWRFNPASGVKDGRNPQAGLVEGADGYLYATTLYGGNPLQPSGMGTIIRLSKQVDPATGVSDESVFWAFGNSGYWDGRAPNALILGRDGNFYGATSLGGLNDQGTAFKITPDGVESVVFSSGSLQIGDPIGLLQASDGNFYGTSLDGGTAGYGGLYRFSQ